MAIPLTYLSHSNSFTENIGKFCHFFIFSLKVSCFYIFNQFSFCHNFEISWLCQLIFVACSIDINNPLHIYLLSWGEWTQWIGAETKPNLWIPVCINSSAGPSLLSLTLCTVWAAAEFWALCSDTILCSAGLECDQTLSAPPLSAWGRLTTRWSSTRSPGRCLRNTRTWLASGPEPMVRYYCHPAW